MRLYLFISAFTIICTHLPGQIPGSVFPGAEEYRLSVLKDSATTLYEQEKYGDCIELISKPANGFVLDSLHRKSWDRKEIITVLANAFLKLRMADSARYFHQLNMDYQQRFFPDSSTTMSVHNLGITYWLEGKYDSAYQKLEQSALEWEKSGEHEYLVNLYINLSVIVGELGQRHRSAEYNELALAHARKDSVNNLLAFSYIYNRRGVIFQEADNTKDALRSFRKAYENSKRFLRPDHPIYDLHFVNLGNAHLGLRNYDSAIYYTRLSLAILEKNYGSPNAEEFANYENLAGVYKEKNNIDSAAYYYKKALENVINFTSVNNSYLAKLYNDLGYLYSETPLYDSTHYYFNLSAKVILGDLPMPEFLKDQRLPYHKSLLRTFLGVADARKKEYQETSNSENRLKAINAYQHIITYISKTPYTLRNEDEWLINREALETVSASLLELLYKMPDGQLQENQVLDAINFGKSLLLKKHQAMINKKLMVAEDRELFEQEALLLNEISDLQRIGNPQDQSRQYQALLNKKRALDLVSTRIAELYPDIYRKNNLNLEVADVRNQLQHGEGMLQYAVVPDGIYTLLVTEKEVRLHFSQTDSLFRSAIADFTVADPGIPVDSLLLKRAYQLLISPVLKDTSLTSLVIVPSDYLWNLDFEVLIDSQDHYLLEKYATRFAFSAELLDEQVKRTKPAKNKVLAFAYNNPGKEKRLIAAAPGKRFTGNLPGSSKELEAIAEIASGDFFYGQQAGKERFKTLSRDYRILHLALHGEVNTGNQESAYLLFPGMENSTGNDYKLFVSEIFGLQLNAELAVLSACDSGTGKLSKGEGLLSVGRSFAVAGVPSLVLSRWQLADQASASIMKDFYRNLKSGMTKSAALREAKRSFISGGDNLTSHPFYWSSYFVLGNNNPVILAEPREHKFIIPLVVVISILLSGLGLWYYIRSFRSSSP